MRTGPTCPIQATPTSYTSGRRCSSPVHRPYGPASPLPVSRRHAPHPPRASLYAPHRVGSAAVILSDRTIREELASGRIVIEPFDESHVQPSSVDIRLDRFFRVFLNHTMPVIDVKRDLEELTRLRSEEHTYEPQSLMRISYAVFCLKKKTNNINKTEHHTNNE